MLTFNKAYLALSVLLFVTEILIALFVHDSFIRPYVGDALVVILIYCLVKSFLNLPVYLVCLVTLAFAYTIEFMQYLKIVETLRLEKSTLARIVLGTSFSKLDLLAYTVGIFIVWITEKRLAKMNR